MTRWLIVLLLLVASTAGNAAEQTAHDLGGVKGVIQHKEGKQSFDEQIEGKMAPNVLGSVLPAGLTREAIVRLLAPHADPARIMLVGAKPWRHVANGYVAIVCAAHEAADVPEKNATPSCDSHPDVVLGVITLQPGSTEPQLVAQTPPGFALTSEWGPPRGAPALLPTVAPAQLDADTSDDDTQWPRGRSDSEVTRFDFAPYRIAPDAFAFGLRSDQTEGYSGGYGTFETLHLFVIEGKTLRRVLVQPIYAMQMTAGDWNTDGTRVHQVDEAKIVLGVSSALTAGHYDLTVKQLGAHAAPHIVLWDAAKDVYSGSEDAR